jgi:TrpR family trp operon transcriptional repressor
MKYSPKFGKQLEKILQKAAKNPKLLHEFLSDLLSPAEYRDFAVRWQIVRQLQKRVPQRKISKNLKVSIATVSRGSRELLNKKGGFAKIAGKTK